MGGLGLVLVLVSSAVVASILFGSRPPGPLATDDAANVAFGLGDGQEASWGMVLPVNPTGAEMTIESIDPVDTTGLDVLGVSVSFPAVDGSLVNSYGYPPPGIDTHAVNGTVLPAVGSAHPEVQAVIGLRLAAEAQSGSIGGLRVRYASSDGKYETVLPWSLTIDRNDP